MAKLVSSFYFILKWFVENYENKKLNSANANSNILW